MSVLTAMRNDLREIYSYNNYTLIFLPRVPTTWITIILFMEEIYFLEQNSRYFRKYIVRKFLAENTDLVLLFIVSRS